jgi:hypothetical protein
LWKAAVEATSSPKLPERCFYLTQNRIPVLQITQPGFSKHVEKRLERHEKQTNLHCVNFYQLSTQLWNKCADDSPHTHSVSDALAHTLFSNVRRLAPAINNATDERMNVGCI